MTVNLEQENRRLSKRCFAAENALHKARVEIGRLKQCKVFVYDAVDELDCECEQGDYVRRHGASCLRCAALAIKESFQTKDNTNEQDQNHD